MRPGLLAALGTTALMVPAAVLGCGSGGLSDEQTAFHGKHSDPS